MRFFGKNTSTLSDEQIMESIGRGSHSALDELYARYSRRLWFYCLKMLGDSYRAEDVVHDLFMMLIERPERFDCSRKFSTWIFSCAYNSCKNEYRRRQTRNEIDFDTDEIAEAGYALQINEYDKQLFRDILEKELDAFGIEHRSVFLLRHNEEFSIKEIAEAVDIPEGTVKSRLYTVTKRLADRMKMFAPVK